MVCGVFIDDGITYHHLYSQKSFPEYKYKEWNLISVDQLHHNLFHAKGISYMADKYPTVKEWLLFNGWRFELNKWRH